MNKSTQPTPEVRLIVAYSRNRSIGKDNTLIWRLPGDLKHFKRHTLGHPIIMGRRTWESLGKPLPNRLNIVLTSGDAADFEGAQIYRSLEAALASVQAHDVVYIIGGTLVYEQALPYAHVILATEIHADIEGDAHFPVLEPGEWEEISRQAQPPENGLPYDFVTYVRTSSKSS